MRNMEISARSFMYPRELFHEGIGYRAQQPKNPQGEEQPEQDDDEQSA